MANAIQRRGTEDGQDNEYAEPEEGGNPRIARSGMNATGLSFVESYVKTDFRF